MSETAVLRQRLDLAARGVPISRPTVGANCSILKLVEDDDFPTDAGRMFAVVQVSVECEEEENASPTFVEVPGQFYALHVGGEPPEQGAHVLATLVQGLWVFG